MPKERSPPLPVDLNSTLTAERSLLPRERSGRHPERMRREISRCNMPLSSKPINLRLHCNDLGPYVARSLRSSLLILPTSEPIVSAPKAASAVECAREKTLRNVRLEFDDGFQSRIKVQARMIIGRLCGIVITIF